MTAVGYVPVMAGLFTVESETTGRLIGGSCPACGQLHFPRFVTCPYCSAENCVERALSDRGTLYLYTSVRNRPPGYHGEVPFGFGIVELPEGIRVITRLTESDPDRLRPGMAVRLVLTPVQRDDQGRQVLSYAFAPAAD